MIALLSIFYLVPFFILSLLYSGQFLIIFFGFFLNLIVLISRDSSPSDQAYNYFVIDNLIRAISAYLIIIFSIDLKDLSSKSQSFNKNFFYSIKNFAFNNKLILNLIYTQLFFIGYVLIVSPDFSILSFNRVSTISLTIPGIRYIYPFFIALSPSILTSSLLGILTFKKIRFSFLHYTLLFLCLINVFLIGQRGYLLMTLFIAFLTSFLYSIYNLIKGKLDISKFKSWLIVLFSFPIIYNLRNLNKLGQYNSFGLKNADLEQLKAWQGSIDVVNNVNISIPPIFNNIFNFLNHQTRIDLGLANSSDIINDFLNLYGYYDKGFGLNITIPMDLYVSFQGYWLWIPTLLIYYSLILYSYIQCTKFFLFKKNNLLSYFLITCAFTSIISGLGGWPLALIFCLESILTLSFKNNKNLKS